MKCSCGKLISRHMHGKCLACRYEEMKKVKVKEPVQCEYCGKEYFPSIASSKYCSEECRTEARKKKNREAKVIKLCLRCGRGFETTRFSSRWSCDECRDKIQGTSGKSPKADSKARAEKMRKIKASGMTYGQYMANRGIKPQEPEEYRGTLGTTQSWMSGSGTIQVHPDEAPEPPRARIRRKVI